MDDEYASCLILTHSRSIAENKQKNGAKNFITGKKMTELSHDRLPCYYVSISIRGTELAVAGLDENKLLLFEIV